jgi:predicted nuclease of restriction endonuclease-like (RecB) superfamily
MSRSRTRTPPRSLAVLDGYDSVLRDLVGLLQDARRAAARSVNAVMTATYFEVGRRLVEEEQRGHARAGYGEALVERLATDLSARFGRGFGRSNLFQMRAFYLAFREKVQAVAAQLPGAAPREKVQTLSGQRDAGGAPGKVQPAAGQSCAPDAVEKVQPLAGQSSAPLGPSALAAHFSLPWSHYVYLLAVRSPAAREFYEAESLRGGWTKRQLRRQIDSQFYERTMLSRNKAAMLRKGEIARSEDAVTPEEQIKDPYLLEFLDLKDEYSETELESALVAKLEAFLLELGGDFTFVGRQRRLRIGDTWYRVDLLFFHRRLRCLVIIDLKLGAFTHADAGQMHLYLNYAREHWVVSGENPPVGLILCAEKDAAVARYALEGLPNKVLAAEYRTALPDEQTLAAEVRKARLLVERNPR